MMISPFDSFLFFNYEVSPVSLTLIFIVSYITYYLLLVKEYPKLICNNDALKKLIVNNTLFTRQMYWPLLWGFSGRIQTILSCVARSFHPVTYEREVFVLPDSGEVILDWADIDARNNLDNNQFKTSPICIFLPGLTGCSQSNYMTHLVSAVNEKNFRAVVFNYRGKGGSKLKTPRTYSALSIDDFNEVVEHVHSKYPDAPLLACGVSLGGMMLFNYLAIKGNTTCIDAAMVISIAWNVKQSAASLEKPLNRILFNRHLAGTLASDIRDNSKLFEEHIDLDNVYSVQTIREFDHHFTTRVFGYSSVDEYYSAASPHSKIENIRIPVLCLSSADDPFAPMESLPLKEISCSESLALILTSRGGHVGFIERLWVNGPGSCTLMERVLQEYSVAIFSNLDQVRKLPGVNTINLGLTGPGTSDIKEISKN